MLNHRSRPAALAVATLLLASTLATNGCGDPDPISWRHFAETGQVDPPGPAEARPSTPDVVVYLDVSRSMQGYVARTGSSTRSIYSRTLKAVQDLAGTGRALHLRLVGETVEPPLGGERAGATLDEATRNAGIYASGSTNLVDAFRDMSRSIDGTPDGPPPALSILISDGVESKPRQGVDPTALKSALEGFVVRERWAGTVMALKSQFDGVVASEETGGRVPLRSGDDPARFRPFYVFALSPNRADLDAFADALRRDVTGVMATVPGVDPASLVREFRLASPYAAGPVEARMECADASKLSTVAVRTESTPPPKFGFKQDDRDHTFTVTVTRIPWAPYATESLPARELMGLLTWKVEPLRYAGDPDLTAYNYPKLTFVDARVGDGGEAIVTLKSSLPAGSVKDPGSAVYRLEGVLDADKLRAAKGPSWVDEWSTDDDSRPAGATRTYRLDRSLRAGLWCNVGVTGAPVARIYVRVTGS